MGLHEAISFFHQSLLINKGATDHAVLRILAVADEGPESVDHALGLFRLVGSVGQRPQEFLQLARTHSRCLTFLAGKFGHRGDLHLEIRCGDMQVSVLLFKQHVRKNWQRVSALHDACHRLQRLQQRVARNLF